MAYFKPYIDEAGMHIPTYNEIVESLCLEMQRIFGKGIYLGFDSVDYQMIAIFAEKINDANEASLVAYNSRNPDTAIGIAQDGLYSINGVKRKTASRSVCEVQITGTPGTIINNGSVTDVNGIVWDLPASVIIPESGILNSTVTCRVTGTIYAAENTLTIIKTPVLGWIGVTNPTPSTVGSVTESDSAFRGRRMQSVSLPSQAMLDGLRGAIGQLNGVTRYAVMENDRNEEDGNGIPPHSICCVVEGGEDQEIADTVYMCKSPGCGTWGDCRSVVQDGSDDGIEISFMRPKYVDAFVTITIKRGVGYFDAIPGIIRSSVVDFLSTLSLGDALNISSLWWAAVNGVRDISSPGFSISSVVAGTDAEAQSMQDINLEFNQAFSVNANNVAVVVEY